MTNKLKPEQAELPQAEVDAAAVDAAMTALETARARNPRQFQEQSLREAMGGAALPKGDAPSEDGS